MTVHENRARILVRVAPNAARNEVAGFANGVFRIKIAAPPVKGKANRELVAFLSRRLGLGKDGAAIIKGHTSRDKTVAIHGLNQEVVTKLLLPDRGA